MRDKGPIKIICRIITLIEYMLILGLVILQSNIIPELEINIPQIETFKIILLIAIPLIIIMIISLIIKYNLEDKSKVNIYRIMDVITRTISTIPITLVGNHFLSNYFEFEPIITIITGVILFVAINVILKFTLQETMNVSFIMSDNL